MWKKLWISSSKNSRARRPTPYDVLYRKIIELQGEEKPKSGLEGLYESLAHLYGEDYAKNLPVEELLSHYEGVISAHENELSVPIYEQNGQIYRESDRNGLTAGEAIEVLEFSRVAKQLQGEERDLNLEFNLGLTIAAILIRPKGVKLPWQRGQRDDFIEKRKIYWFDNLSYGDYLALNKWFSGKITALRDLKEFQFFWKGRPRPHTAASKKSSETLQRERIEREISDVVGLRSQYMLANDLYGSFEAMFYADFTDFVFRTNLKIAQGQ